MSFPFAAGAVRSTANDLVRWHRALTGDIILGGAARAKLYRAEKGGYAYGWVVAEMRGRSTDWHNGAIDGFTTTLWRIPSADVVVVAWTSWAVKWARGTEGIERHYPDLPRSIPLPNRHPDGRYSVRGAAERFGVSVDQVRRWMKRGLVEAKQEDFKQHRGAYWIRLDGATVRRLEKLRSSRSTVSVSSKR